MIKKKLPLILSVFFIGLVLTTYIIRTNLINLAVQKNELIYTDSNSNENNKDSYLLDKDLNIESFDSSTSNIVSENTAPNTINTELVNDEVEVIITPEVNAPKEEPQADVKESESEDWKNWRPGIDTLQLLLPNVNSEPRTETTTHVVMHFASNAANNPTNPYNINDTYSIFQQYEVSSHYVIDRSGQVYLFVPETRVAYHAGTGIVPGFPTHNNRLNHYSIGIELLAIGTKAEMTPIITAPKFDLIPKDLIGYTDSQYNALNILLDDILRRNPNIKKDRNHIIGHDEYNSSKTDPGSLFDWSKLSL